MNRRLRSARRAGFTLMEIMVALVIIGVIMGIVGYNLIGVVGKAKTDATIASMRTVQGALQQYFVQYNGYPGSGQLAVLVNTRLLAEMPKDAWGREFDYYSPTQGFPYELISYGEDGLPQTTDDINVHPEPQVASQ